MLYDVYVSKYGAGLFHNADELVTWLKSSNVFFTFKKFSYIFCILKNSYSKSFHTTIEIAKDILRGHHNCYTLSVLLIKLKERNKAFESLTEDDLFILLNNDSNFSLERRSFLLCTLTEEGVQIAINKGWKKSTNRDINKSNSTGQKTSNQLEPKISTSTPQNKNNRHGSELSLKDTDHHFDITIRTRLGELISRGILTEREVLHCKKKKLYSVGQVKKFIEKNRLTLNSSRYTEYTLNILFKIVELLPRQSRSHHQSYVIDAELRTGRNNSDNTQEITPPSRFLTVEQEKFIKEFYAEHNKSPLWFELFQAVQYIQHNSYHLSIEKVLQKIEHQSEKGFGKKTLLDVRQEYQLHKFFYFLDEQPLSSWREEQLAEVVTEYEFFEFVAATLGFDIIALEQDKVMIRTIYTDAIKPLEREIKKCINANAGSNTLILIDELLPTDIDPELEEGLKQFASAWLKRHYQVDVSGDSFWA